MEGIKNKLLTSMIGIATALTLSYGVANADLLVLKDGSKIYNYKTIKLDDNSELIRTKEGKELRIPKSEIKDYVYITDSIEDGVYINEETAEKLKEIKGVENWAEERLGLPQSDNFLRYDQSSEIVHLVYYSDPLHLPENYWDLFNELFYKQEEALKLKKELEEQDWDVYYRVAEALAESPIIYKSLLHLDLYVRVNAVIHENTHDHVNFPPALDEGCAIILGEYGALDYLLEKLGKDSEEYKKETLRKNNMFEYAGFVIKTYNELKEILNSDMLTEEKLKQKKELLDNLHKKRAKLWLRPVEKMTNAVLVSDFTYCRYLPLMEKLYEKAGSTKEVRKVLKELSDIVADKFDEKEFDKINDFSKKYLEDYLSS